MSTTPAFELRVGGRVWLDGQGWEVAELTGNTVRLIADGRLRTVSVTSLIGNDQVDDDLPDSRSEDLWTVPAVVLAGLSTRQRDVLTHKPNVIFAAWWNPKSGTTALWATGTKRRRLSSG